MKKPIYILGISESHTATAALLKDGEIIACVSEERFTRKKLQPGIPTQAIKFCLDFAKIGFNDITEIAVADIEPPFIDPTESPYNKLKPPPPLLIRFLFYFEEKIETKYPQFKKYFYKIYQTYMKLRFPQRQKRRFANLRKIIPLPENKFTFIKHHICHSSAALFACGFAESNQPVLIFTCDAVGDYESGSVSKFENNKIKRLSTISFQQSIGFFYQHITQQLGLKPVEDEYKVMGLAPYADQKKSETLYNLLAKYFEINKSENKWFMTISEYHLWRKLPKLLHYKRFDHIAAATQKIIEEILVAWIKNAIANYKIKNVVCSGGVFANVKANLKIAQIKGIKKAFFMPSPGDETNAIGAAYYCYFNLTKKIPSPLSHLYLGSSFSDEQIKKSIKKYLYKSAFKIIKPKNITLQVAKLLSQGEVVARFAGRMEFGARALGNRSILASPKNRDSVEFINSAIKSRDFWMPFAPTILRERTKDYIIPHHADSSFMNVAFNTTPQAVSDLCAAIHPNDKTTRPQILDRETNPNYFNLIKKFEDLTNIGALLNTSFNLHGEPIVATPEDAIRVFKKTKLKHLVLEQWLISKK